MILYHGSNVIVDHPKLIRQNRYLDFGFGFYTTTNRDQAVNFAQKVTDRRKTGAAVLNIYSVRILDRNDLDFGLFPRFNGYQRNRMRIRFIKAYRIGRTAIAGASVASFQGLRAMNVP